MSAASEAPVAVLSPHLDDAVLSAWSVLTAGQTTVLNVCSGVPSAQPVAPWDRVTGAGDASKQMHARIEEDRAALAMAGAEPVSLGMLDAQYRTRALDPSEICELARRALPHVSVLYVPAGIGGHPDHLAVRASGFELARELGKPLAFYADQPYASRFGWPAWVSGEPADSRRVPEADWNRWLPELSGGPKKVRPQATHLDDRTAAAKLAAMRRYESQFPALDGGGLRRLSNPYVYRFEVVWKLEP